MFERFDLLVGEENRKKIQETSILLVGVGGVGGACFEACVRLGIGHITVIDGDTFSASNLNRQILATKTNIGCNKAEEAKKRALEITDMVNVKVHPVYLTEENKEILNGSYDFIIDCCDDLKAKMLLITYALEQDIPIVVATGSGQRLDASKLYITSIWETNNDPLARVLRKKLREAKISVKIPVVASKEIPIKTGTTTIASCSVVPNTAGFLLASYVFSAIIRDRK